MEATGGPRVRPGAATVWAPAKVNLYLHVLERRPDGYHDIDSLAVFASVADRIDITLARSWSLTVSGPCAAGVPANESNLVLRAVRVLAARLGERGAAHIALGKHIPVAAGLGGGSSDAAAVLRALLSLWRRRLSPAALGEIGASLGADVPFCLGRGAARLGGVGERVSPLTGWRKMAGVLVNPGRPLATKDVFAAWRAPGSGRAVRLPRDGGRQLRLVEAAHNDLTTAAQQLEPAVTRVLEALAAQAGCRVARMSGSGPTCFGLFSDRVAASRAAAAMTQRQPDWWVRAVTLGNREAVSPCAI
ncbi:MAG: 4-(cytidine 5'-diphospho)-2-C-methyl-D-erythritol kinase [Alphaproteobacteria bacterium]|nr:4-(cytidine 5'-diphospho)-2-C-methyl-D-erythritol kinase [Alphaproteobacteria bacterium]